MKGLRSMLMHGNGAGECRARTVGGKRGRSWTDARGLDADKEVLEGNRRRTEEVVDEGIIEGVIEEGRSRR